MKKIAIITGIYGQDGSYLAELLIDKNYETHGFVGMGMAADLQRQWRIEGIRDKITLHECDLMDRESVAELINVILPNEIYRLFSLWYMS